MATKKNLFTIIKKNYERNQILNKRKMGYKYMKIYSIKLKAKILFIIPVKEIKYMEGKKR